MLSLAIVITGLLVAGGAAKILKDRAAIRSLENMYIEEGKTKWN